MLRPYILLLWVRGGESAGRGRLLALRWMVVVYWRHNWFGDVNVEGGKLCEVGETRCRVLWTWGLSIRGA